MKTYGSDGYGYLFNWQDQFLYGYILSGAIRKLAIRSRKFVK